MKKRSTFFRTLLFSTLFFALLNTLNAQVMVKDMFGRELNNYHVSLVDWQGHLSNPKVELELTPPQSGVSFPLTVDLKAEGSSRLMFDYPSTLSSTGAAKTVTFDNAGSTQTVFLAIAPDRQGGYGEIESYTLTFEYAGTSNSIPIKVLDQDDDFEPALPLKFDYRYDDINGAFINNPGLTVATEMAIKDWFYFFDFSSFDQVAVGDEDMSLPGTGFTNHIQVTNNEAYNGWWVFLRGIGGPYSTGYPATNNKYHKQNGVQVPGPLHRSGALIVHQDENTNWFTSVDDDEWYLSDIYQYDDAYTLTSHEFGHTVALNFSWDGMANYRDNYTTIQKVIDYQGTAVPIDASAHIQVDQEAYWDRISGQPGAYVGTFPIRRWFLTKLTLLIAEQAGWTLRDIGPFIAPEITTSQLAAAEIGSAYSETLESNGGGVAIYDWTISSGTLPAGLTLNRFTGEISGNVSAAAGTYYFTVQLKDADELQAAVTKQLSIQVASCPAPETITYTIVSPTEVDINWSATTASSYTIWYRDLPDGTWINPYNGTGLTYTLTGLTPDTSYELWVNSNCPDGSTASSSITFTTETCQAPTNVTLANMNTSSVTVNWSDVGADNYTVWYAETGVWNWQSTCNGTTGTTCTITGLTSGTNYTINVNSYCGGNSSTTELTFTTETCQAPANITATNVADISATINWDLSFADSYYVSYAETGVWNWQYSGNLTTGTFNLTGLTPGTNYTVYVTSNCSDGSTPSDNITITTEACEAPANITATNVADISATINWDLSFADSYYVSYAETGVWNWQYSGNLTTDTYTLVGLTPGTDYTVYVTSNCSDGTQPADFITITTETCAATANVTATNISTTSATINWDNAFANSYYIYYQPVGGAWTLACNGTTDNTCTLTGLTANTDYTVWVNSVCPDGGNPGNSTTFKTQANPASAPAMFDDLTTDVSVLDESILQVYPNPVRDILNVYRGEGKENLKYAIYGISGVKLLESSEPRLDVSRLPQGVYTLKTKDKVIRFVKL